MNGIKHEKPADKQPEVYCILCSVNWIYFESQLLLGVKNIKQLIECSSPRKSLVKGERFIRLMKRSQSVNNQLVLKKLIFQNNSIIYGDLTSTKYLSREIILYT